MNDSAPDSEPRFEVKRTADSHFAWLRTRLSVERTLMSWMRTSTALIGFGFTIVQFFERIAQMQDVRAALRPEMPRYLGLALIAAGTTALAISVWQYRAVLRYLGSKEFAPVAYLETGPRQTPLLGLAVFLGLTGTVAFLSVLLRVR
jgi:putative membrane protein